MKEFFIIAFVCIISEQETIGTFQVQNSQNQKECKLRANVAHKYLIFIFNHNNLSYENLQKSIL